MAAKGTFELWEGKTKRALSEYLGTKEEDVHRQYVRDAINELRKEHACGAVQFTDDHNKRFPSEVYVHLDEEGRSWYVQLFLRGDVLVVKSFHPNDKTLKCRGKEYDAWTL